MVWFDSKTLYSPPKTMDLTSIKDIEELVICNLCKQKFNHIDLPPKLLSCKHYFCLPCIRSTMVNGMEVLCIYCWKPTEIDDQDPEVLPTYNPILVLSSSLGNIRNSINVATNASCASDTTDILAPDKDKKLDICMAHNMPLSLWCKTCFTSICRICTSSNDQMHVTHQIMSQDEAKEKLLIEVQTETVSIAKLVNEVQRLVFQQRHFLLKVLEACVTLKAFVETDLQHGLTVVPEVDEARTLLNRTQSELGHLDEINDIQLTYSNLIQEKRKLQNKCQEMYMQCRMDALIRNANVAFDFSLIRRMLDNINTPESSLNLNQHLSNGGSPLPNDPILFLANYCMSQLYSRDLVSKQQQQQQQQHTYPFFGGSIGGGPSTSSGAATTSRQCLLQNGVGGPHLEFASSSSTTTKSPCLTPNMYGGVGGGSAAAAGSSSVNDNIVSSTGSSLMASGILQQPTAVTSGPGAGPSQSTPPISSSTMGNPLNGLASFIVFYFNVEVNGSPFGRFLIETRPDVAPKMVRNFAALTNGELGFGYKGCLVFQCWSGESIITGDFELNNGRGGRSIYDEGFFIPDDTKFPATRGAVGMRRTQKKHDSLGMVGSQFRVILQEMKGFTAIFGHVVEGLDLIEKITTFGDATGKPTKNVVISSCGKLM